MEKENPGDEERRLRSQLRGKDDPEKFLRESCLEVYQAVNLHPAVRAYLFRSQAEENGKDTYYYVLFHQSSGKRRLVVGEESYPSEKAAIAAALTALRYFPLYGFSSRYLL
jgi:hypothetical protein